HRFAMLTELFKSLPPEVQMETIDIVIEASDIPHREELVERLRSKMGAGVPSDPEEARQMQEEQDRQRQIEEAFADLELAEKQALVEQLLAEIRHTEAKTEKLAGADTDLADAKTVHELEKADTEKVEQRRKGLETAAQIVESASSSENEGGEKRQNEA
ncbi:MAG: hypothetical protein OXG44_21335, partial [Gammaproteobacteria bacterium]|nr:hypothetical protein [Gammaproteobacteria bacterium]